tara:strand:- start:530 stop:709 length:180 start_codon:yes stop_codon:yes gene_type:complete
MSGSTGYRIEVAIIDNNSDADGATATITRRGDHLSHADLEEAFTAAIKAVGFQSEVGIE